MTKSVPVPSVRKMQRDWCTTSVVKDIPQTQRGVKLGIFVPRVTRSPRSASLSLRADLALPASQVGSGTDAPLKSC